ncbi:MAG: hypothetical protein Q8M98_11530 [Candidatus Cloacimonadaceae bacterium]|nr:hypothetical protein [Candidatus Cloacimonadaceae bacterium]
MGEEDQGTIIQINHLNEEISEILVSSAFHDKLIDRIRITYCLIIKDHITIHLNNIEIDAPDLDTPKYATKDSLSARVGKYNDVDYKVICYIDTNKATQGKAAFIGWNLFCNKRLILPNDTSFLTGWRGKDIKGYLPKYHNLYNQFVGLVFIESNDPSSLPLNTAKNALNTDNSVYVKIIGEMMLAASPIIKYLSNKHEKQVQKESEITAELEDIDKESQSTIKGFSISKTLKNKNFSLKLTPTKKEQETISFVKEKGIVDLVKERLGVKSNRDVGDRVFDYYVKLEELIDE